MKNIEYRGLNIEIYQDIDAESPREGENSWVLHCEHRRYNLGDSTPLPEGEFKSVPIFAYDHGGIRLATKPFNDRFDSGQLGIAWPREESATLEMLEYEIKAYNQYLNGDIWGFCATDNTGDCIDSCGGFFGVDDAITEGKASIDWHLDRATGVQMLLPLSLP